MSPATPASASEAVEHALRSGISDQTSRALAVGAKILDELFDGDLTAWRSGAGETTLRELARDPRLGVSASTLYRYVAVVSMLRTLKLAPANLKISHLRELLPIDEDATRAALLSQADAERWTVSRLRKAVQAVLQRQGRNTTATGWRTAFQALERWATHPARLNGLPRDVRQLGRGEALVLLRTIRSAKVDLEIIETRLELAMDAWGPGRR